MATSSASPPEAWLRRPLPGIDPVLMPAAHALMQAREDLTRATADASTEALWARPVGAASAGFHPRHLAGRLDRLLAYARGEQLTPAQVAAIPSEGAPGALPAELVAGARAAIDRALQQLRITPPAAYSEVRPVGRAALPATVLGLLVHAAEHASRHAGRLITTLKIVRGLRSGSAA